MKIEFNAQKMLLANVNARSEVHGEEREPAGDLKLEVDCSNDILAEFNPALKSLLYHYDEGREHDLADEGKRGGDYKPDLRMPSLAAPLRWDEEMAGASFALRVPGAKTEVALEPVKVNNFAIEPREGGTVSLSFRVQAHPDERAFGKLACLVQQEVEVTITAGSEPGN